MSQCSNRVSAHVVAMYYQEKKCYFKTKCHHIPMITPALRVYLRNFVVRVEIDHAKLIKIAHSIIIAVQGSGYVAEIVSSLVRYTYFVNSDM